VAALTLLDTGPLVALMDRSEEHHEWARATFTGLRLPLPTCQAVITETCFVLRHEPEPLAKFCRHVGRGDFVDAFDFATLAPRAMGLMERYANVPMSFADPCLVTLAEQSEEARVVTLDRDFLIYRRSDGRSVGILAPFAQ
jgi:predicted nucleic acid-binding protein